MDELMKLLGADSHAALGALYEVAVRTTTDRADAWRIAEAAYRQFGIFIPLPEPILAEELHIADLVRGQHKYKSRTGQLIRAEILAAYGLH
ncbi:hypothetical protein OTB20_08445 [Streptomyces sp. H27-H1]|uniref:hypothetical protein n=1 Tax=Streptomyces sp. H27-H1 TaxID=2996461 RepID=UPI00226D5250|nr:hypothetical protein [Streptomyces sp. H27-H1]MCY0926234.1 hypothetical protein [Streptomyces sp. H27-H1]